MGRRIEWGRAHHKPCEPIAPLGPRAAFRSRSKPVVPADELAVMIADYERRKAERDDGKAMTYVRKRAKLAERTDPFIDAARTSADARAHLLRVADEQERRRAAARVIASMHNGARTFPLV